MADSIPKEFEHLKKMSSDIKNLLDKDLSKKIKQVGSIMEKMQPKLSKRVIINGNKATATLGQSDNVMIDFDDAVEGNKFYKSLTPISDVGNNNS